jgi:GNAT superfamily N-acetyltransferase
MKVTELVQQELKDQIPFHHTEHTRGGLVWTAHSNGNFDLTIDLKNEYGKQLAYVTFEINEEDDNLNSADTWVAPEMRRLGIATRMYNWAESLGNTIVKSKFLSAQGKKYWKAREKAQAEKHKQISELFEPSSALPSEYEENGGQWVARSYDQQGRLIETWFIEYKPGWVDFEFERGGSKGITGHGSEHQVFATVLANAAEYLKTHSPNYIVFSGGEDNRQALYSRMANRLSQQYGYRRLATHEIPVKEYRSRKIFVLQKSGEASAQKSAPAKQQRS